MKYIRIFTRESYYVYCPGRKTKMKKIRDYKYKINSNSYIIYCMM